MPAMMQTSGGGVRTRSAALLWPAVIGIAVAAGWAISVVGAPNHRVLEAVPFLLVLASVIVIIARERLMNGVGLLGPLGIAVVTYGLMFGAVPLADIRYDNPVIHQVAWWRGAWLVLLGLWALYAGFRVMRVVYPPVDLQRDHYWNSRRAGIIAVALLAVALGSLMVEFARIGVHTYFLRFADRHSLVQNGVSLLIRITMATPAVLLLAGNWLHRPSRRKMLFLLVVLLPPVLFASAFLGQRWRALTLIVALIAVYHVGFRPISRVLMTALVMILAVAFVVYGSERSSIGKDQTAPALAGDNFYYNYVNKHEIGQFRDFVITVQGVPSRLPFQHGRTYLALIPGAPFPTASYLFSTTFFPHVYSKGTSIPTPLPGELYLNFGPWGIFVGMALFGCFLASIQSYFDRHRGSIGAVLIFAYSLVPIAGIVRGDFTTFAGYFALGMIPLLLALRFIQRPVEGSELTSAPHAALARTPDEGGFVPAPQRGP
jgi:oligosaccharide repeat unit polymerase